MVVHLVYTPTSRIDGMLIPWGSQGIPEVGLVRTERLDQSYRYKYTYKSMTYTYNFMPYWSLLGLIGLTLVTFLVTF